MSSSTGIQVATEPMFAGRDLSDVSGPNGISGPDVSDFAFVAGSTAAGGWAAIPREASGGTGKLTDLKERAAQSMQDRHQQAVTDRVDAREWAQAQKDGTFDTKVKQETANAVKPVAEQARKDAVADHLRAAGNKASDPAVQQDAARAGKKAARKAAADAESALSRKIGGRAAQLAAKKGAVLAAKQAGLRAAALAVGAAIPGPGWLVAGGFLVGSLIIDQQMRNMITGIFASGLDANQPPAPPTTTWLPATDDNRQNDIGPADAKLAALNEHISGIEPGSRRLWHLQDSEVPALTNLSGAVSKLNAATARAAEVSSNYTALLNNAPEQWGEKLKTARSDAAQVIADFGPKAGAPMATALSAAAAAGNEAYQRVREGNAMARQQLANSHGRFLGFLGGGYGAENLSANIPAIEEAARGVAEADQRISDAVRDWSTAAVRAEPGPIGASLPVPESKAPEPDKDSEEKDTALLEPTSPIATSPSADTAPPGPDLTPPQGINNPLAGPGGAPMGMGPLGGAGNPFGGAGPSAGPKPLSDIMSNLPEPPTKPDDAGEISDDVLPDDEQKTTDNDGPQEPKPDEGPRPKAQPEPVVKVDEPGPEIAEIGATTEPSAVVNVEGVGPVDFKDPKIAEVVQRMQNAEDGAPVSVRAAAQDLGIPIGEPGADIGSVVAPDDLQPGHVVSSADGKDYIYVGEDQVLGEDKKIYPLSKVAVFDSSTDGLFSLDTGFVDDQGTPQGVDDGGIQLAAVEVPGAPTPAAASPQDPPVIVPPDAGLSGQPPVDPPAPGSVPGMAPIDPTNILP
ncbi:hypothetical protein ACNUDN_30175 [Mycobacterium sp. smrl_JER01]|uniref:hypothetical protein n=1 Tax=Mycobacterium sp. smrl_JER01 TaxID=3402633 RepID=UPI003AC77E44